MVPGKLIRIAEACAIILGMLLGAGLVSRPAAAPTVPTVRIIRPRTGAMFYVGDPVLLGGSALDAVDGELSDLLEWSSDRDGPLGSGALVSVRLSLGSHVLTAAVRNSAGVVGMDQVALTVQQPPAGNTEPLVAITAPADGEVSGEVVTLTGTAEDLEDGELGEQLAWTSDRDGALGAGESVAALLSPGRHTITAGATDSGGLEGLDSITLDVGGLVSAAASEATMLQFPVVADAYVGSDAPTTNFGSETNLVVESSPAHVAYLRFVVSGIGGQPISQAILRLQVDGITGAGSDSGGRVHRITNDTWQEGTVTYDTRPAVDGPIVDTKGAVAIDEVVDFNVTGAVLGDGSVNFALDTTSSNAVRYRSHESTTGQTPLLIITLGSGTTTTTIVSGTTTSTVPGGTTTTAPPTTTTSAPTTTSATSSSTTTTLPAGQVGYQDFSFGTSVDENSNRATAHKPQSKLWYVDGRWWATLFSTPNGGGHRVHRLDFPLQTWVDTGVLVDERPKSRQDVLWDGVKLYAVSQFGYTGGTAQARLNRFTYVDGLDTFIKDSGFPVSIPGGATESLTVAKDSTGRLWTAFTLGNKVMVSHTLGTPPNDSSWASAFVVPVPEGTSVDSDDIAGVIALLGGKIGVFWANQATQKDYFAVHPDGAAPGASWTQEIAGQGGAFADDHFNMKLASDGRLFVALKTSFNTTSQTQIGLLVRSAAGSWSSLYRVWTRGESDPTRPMLMLNESLSRVYVFASLNQETVHYKSSSMSSISFPTGTGTAFMQSSSVTDINNPTGTKQNVGASTGLVAVASSPGARTYWHNVFPPTVTTTTTSASTTTSTTAMPGATTTTTTTLVPPTTTTTTTTSTTTSTSTTTTLRPGTYQAGVSGPAGSADVDTYIGLGTTSANLGTKPSVFVGVSKSTDKVFRSIIAFNLSDIPAGATVTACRLSVHVLQRANPTPGHVRRLCGEHWLDGNGQSELQATWTNWKTGTAWGAAGAASTASCTDGGDYTTTGQIAYTPPPGTGLFTFPDLSALCQDALDQRGDWLRVRISQDSEATPQNLLKWDSSEGSTPTNRPKLIVTWSQ